MNATDFTNAAGVEQFEAAVKAGQENFEKAVKAGKETQQKAYKASADAVTKGYDKAFALTKEQVEKNFPQMADKFNEFAAFNKETVDAMFSAGAIANKGVETMFDEVAAFNTEALKESVDNTKALFSVKTYQEMVDLQTTLARGAFDRAVAGSTKFSEMFVKLANEVSDPLQSRVKKAADKYTKAAA